MAQEFQLNYGKGFKTVSLADSVLADLFQPVDLPVLPDLEGALDKALDAPLGVLPLEKMPAPAKVALAVPDESRPLPLKRILPLWLKRIFKAFPQLSPSDVTIVVGGGLHPPMEEKALRSWLPAEAVLGCRVLAHDAHNSPLMHFGRTSRGTPVYINAHYAEADLKLVLGQIDPHQFVGFTGGAKGVVVGCAGEATIAHNHGLMFQEGAWVGRLQGNPVREDQNECGRLAGVDMALNLVLNPQKQVLGLWAGEPERVLQAGAQTCAWAYGREIEEPYDLALVSCGGYPKDICLYQAQKGLNLASQAVKPGGKILLLAACDQGVGDDAYYEYACRFADAGTALDDFARTGFKMGAHKCFLFGRTLTSYEVVVDSELDAGTLGHCHLKAGSAQETMDVWLRQFEGAPRVAVVPFGNTTFFYQPGPLKGAQTYRLHN